MHHSQPRRDKSPDQIEGDESRALGARMIESYRRAGVDFPKGDLLSDCYSGAKMYADDVRAVMIERHIFGGDDIGIEQDISCPSISPETQGRFNCAIMDRSRRELFLWIYRYSHTCEPEVDNPRAICYISGLLDAFKVDGKQDQTLKVTVTVVQPRCFTAQPVRRWQFLASDIRGHINRLRGYAEKACDPASKCRSGEYCHGCEARFNCDTAIEGGLIQYEACMVPNINEMSDAEVARRYRVIDRAYNHLNTLRKAYTQRVESIAAAGRILPTLTVEPTEGPLDWDKPAEEVVSMGALFGVDLEKKGTLTPTQAMKAGLPEDVVKEMASRKKTGFKIVPDEKSRLSTVFASVVGK